MIKHILIVLGLLISSAGAYWQTRDSSYNNPPPVAAGYTGPLDVTDFTSPLGWWGLRCGSTSYTGNVVDLWDSATGSTTETTITCSTGGILNTGSPTAIATTCAVACRAKTIYDQSGNSLDMTEATNADRPTYNQSCSGSLPCLVGGTSIILLNSTGIAQSQPYTMVAVGLPASSSDGSLIRFGAGAGAPGWTFSSSSNTVNILCGASQTLSATFGALHAFMGVCNGGSSISYLDGTGTTKSGAGSTATATQVFVFNGGTTSDRFFEGGLFAGALSSGDATAMYNNAHTYWGF